MTRESTMRVKLRSTIAERCISCWYEIDIPSQHAAMAELIQHLTEDLGIDPRIYDVSLELDGFQLAPRSRIHGVLRDGDLIMYAPQW